MGKLVLILGGARSGKSAHAEKLARESGGRVTYVATAEAHDGEMERRIAAHQAARPADWRTVEEPLELIRTIGDVARDSDVVLVDCLTLWLSNHLCRIPESDSSGSWGAAVEGLASSAEKWAAELLEIGRVHDATLLLVSNEVGLGLVPATPLGRAYRDLLGALNRRLAAGADRVLLMVAGLPVDVKRLASP